MIHQPFALIDWMVLCAYLMVVMLIALHVRSSRSSISDYFFARGQMPWWAVGLSLIATSVSSSTFLGNPAEAFAFDLRLLQLNIGVPISIIIICAIFIPYFRQSGARSAYEVLERRFDLKTRTIASTFYMMHVLLRTGVLIYGASILLARISGIDMRLIIVFIGLVTILYTAIGGIRAVIWTDVMQFLILVGGGLLICLFIAVDLPGGVAQAFALASDAGKLRWFDASMSLSDPRTIWGAGIAYIALDLAIRATDQQFVQRYLSCVDLKRTRYAAIFSAILGLLMAMLFFGVGIFLWAYYQSFPSELTHIRDVNMVLPHFIATKLPWGVSGLIVAAVLAAAMSSIDSAMSALSNTATVDFYLRFGGRAERGLWFARAITVLWGLLGVLIAFYAASFGMNIFELALSFTSLFTGSLLGIFLLAVGVKRANGWGAFAGALLGMGTLLFITRIVKLPLAWPWYPVVSMTTTIITGVLISFLTQGAQKRSPVLSGHEDRA